MAHSEPNSGVKGKGNITRIYQISVTASLIRAEELMTSRPAKLNVKIFILRDIFFLDAEKKNIYPLYTGRLFH